MVALCRAGEVIASAAITVMLAFAALLIATIGQLRSLAPGLIIGVGLMLLAALTLVPAILSLFGAGLFWPTTPKPHDPAHRTRSERMGAAVAKRPGIVLLTSVVILVALASGVLNLKVTYNQLAELPQNNPSTEAYNTISSAFPAGFLGPSQVFVSSSTPLDPTAVDALAAKLAHTQGVAQVLPVQYAAGNGRRPDRVPPEQRPLFQSGHRRHGGTHPRRHRRQRAGRHRRDRWTDGNPGRRQGRPEARHPEHSAAGAPRRGRDAGDSLARPGRCRLPPHRHPPDLRGDSRRGRLHLHQLARLRRARLLHPHHRVHLRDRRRHRLQHPHGDPVARRVPAGCRATRGRPDRHCRRGACRDGGRRHSGGDLRLAPADRDPAPGGDRCSRRPRRAARLQRAGDPHRPNPGRLAGLPLLVAPPHAHQDGDRPGRAGVTPQQRRAGRGIRRRRTGLEDPAARHRPVAADATFRPIRRRATAG